MKPKKEIKKQEIKRLEKLQKRKKLLLNLLLIFVIATIVIGLWIIFIKNRVYMRDYKNDYIEFKYDSTWTLSRDTENYIGLTHKTNSLISITTYSLTSKNINYDIEDLADEVKFDIVKQNTSYKLLKEEKSNITEKKYDSYKMLYEDGENQTEVIIIKNDNNLYVINYTSPNNTFDIVLDSFQTVLSSLRLK